VTPPRRSTRAYALIQLVGWTAYGLLGVAVSASFSRVSAGLVATMLGGAATAGAFTHLLRALMKRRRWLALDVRTLLPRLVVAVLVMALVVEAVGIALGVWVLRVYPPGSVTTGVLFVSFLNWAFTLALWVALYVGIRFFRDWRAAEIHRLQVEVAAREAQLETLNAQIHPHFLFNALNTLRALIPDDPARARDLVTELSELMRYALQAGRRDRVPLAEELAVVESYLRIESARFTDRLRWRIEADDEARRATLPPMLLQMLVENAVKHGIAASRDGGEVVVEAARHGAAVRLRVTNPGEMREAGGTRIGLANARERLRLLYDGSASLAVADDHAGLVVAEVSLPYREVEP
jgi:LytS/YehU family sensor histidine kinase